jgi:hypothetical protein
VSQVLNNENPLPASIMHAHMTRDEWCALPVLPSTSCHNHLTVEINVSLGTLCAGSSCFIPPGRVLCSCSPFTRHCIGVKGLGNIYIIQALHPTAVTGDLLETPNKHEGEDEIK